MNRSSVISVAALVILALSTGCGLESPSAPSSLPDTPTLAAPRPEDEANLDEVNCYLMNAMETWYMSGQTDCSYFNAELEKIRDARRSLGVLEEERRMFLEAGEILCGNGQSDLFALSHELQRIETARRDVLRGIWTIAE